MVNKTTPFSERYASVDGRCLRFDHLTTRQHSFPESILRLADPGITNTLVPTIQKLILCVIHDTSHMAYPTQRSMLKAHEHIYHINNGQCERRLSRAALIFKSR
jgi:hypothetical protein